MKLYMLLVLHVNVVQVDNGQFIHDKIQSADGHDVRNGGGAKRFGNLDSLSSCLEVLAASTSTQKSNVTVPKVVLASRHLQYWQTGNCVLL